jgi:hypothetical protein
MQMVMMVKKARYAHALLPLLMTLSMTTALTTIAPPDHGRAAQQQQEPITGAARLPAAGGAVGPVCEVCGCSFCPPGFAVKHPDGMIPIPDGLRDHVPTTGFTEVPCGLLDLAGLSGQIPADVCNDDDQFRLVPAFRASCGCPALPPAPTTAATTGSARPSFAPSLSARPSTSVIPSRWPTIGRQASPRRREEGGVDAWKSRFSISRMVFFLTFALVMVVLMLLTAFILHVQRRRRETKTTTMNKRGDSGAAAERSPIYWQECDRVDQTANYVNAKT